MARLSSDPTNNFVSDAKAYAARDMPPPAVGMSKSQVFYLAHADSLTYFRWHLEAKIWLKIAEPELGHSNITRSRSGWLNLRIGMKSCKARRMSA